MKKLILVDGNSLMFRSYFATAYSGRMMQTKDGKYTNALYGFINMFTKLLNDTEYIFVSFDAGKQTFRHQQFKDYKATRKPLPNELREQIPLIKEYLDILNITRIESLDFEGDDLIASCANQFQNDFDSILVYTGDKDLLQLVNDKVSVALTKKGVGDLDILNNENFYEKMGYYPYQVIEYKGLVGDTSDNLPGIKGIGEKTALKLLEEYKTIDGIYDHLGALKGKTLELFNNGKESAYNSRFLATIKRDIPLDITIDDLKIKPYNDSKLIDFYTKLEFTSFIKRVKDEVNENTVDEPKEIKRIEYATELKEVSSEIYILPEIFGSNYYNGTLLGIGIKDNDKYYFIKKDDIKLISNILLNPDIKKYTYDYKALFVSLLKMDLDIKGISFDALLSSYLIDPSYASDDFKVTMNHFVNTDSIKYVENIYGQNTKAQIPSADIYIDYSMNKLKLLEESKNIILKQINDLELEFLNDVETKLSHTLGLMEYNGLLIDQNRLKEIEDILTKDSKVVEEKIYQEAHHEFNINSPKQLSEVLFTELNLPHGKKNKTGYSTNVEVLEKLSKDYKICEYVLDYRAYTKLINTYVNGMYEVVDDKSFIHPLYRQALTNTGRLSSIEPNIQNMPIRTERGQVIREIFISRYPNGKIISADYSQIELRILASLSNDPIMISSFNEGIDIHTKTASQVFDVPIEEVTKEMRRTSKAINFGIIYGMSAWGLAEQLNITPLEAGTFIDKYFANFKKAKETLDGFVSRAHLFGYSKTLFGRIRNIPELNDKNKAVVAFGERTAMNSPIQGTAADIIKIAMNKVQEELEKQNLKTKMIAQVHDELVFDVPEDEVEIVKDLVKNVMENAVKLNVRLDASVGIGDNWFEAH